LDDSHQRFLKEIHTMVTDKLPSSQKLSPLKAIQRGLREAISLFISTNKTELSMEGFFYPYKRKNAQVPRSGRFQFHPCKHSLGEEAEQRKSSASYLPDVWLQVAELPLPDVWLQGGRTAPYQMSGYREAELPPTRCLATGGRTAPYQMSGYREAELTPTRCLATGRQN
jgi:hypothetical protein